MMLVGLRMIPSRGESPARHLATARPGDRHIRFEAPSDCQPTDMHEPNWGPVFAVYAVRLVSRGTGSDGACALSSDQDSCP